MKMWSFFPPFLSVEKKKISGTSYTVYYLFKYAQWTKGIIGNILIPSAL